MVGEAEREKKPTIGAVERGLKFRPFGQFVAVSESFLVWCKGLEKLLVSGARASYEGILHCN